MRGAHASSKLKALYKKAMALNGLARYTDAEKVVDEGIALACEEADARRVKRSKR